MVPPWINYQLVQLNVHETDLKFWYQIVIWHDIVPEFMTIYADLQRFAAYEYKIVYVLICSIMSEQFATRKNR